MPIQFSYWCKPAADAFIVSAEAITPAGQRAITSYTFAAASAELAFQSDQLEGTLTAIAAELRTRLSEAFGLHAEAA